jgi:hypothetical protein
LPKVEPLFALRLRWYYEGHPLRLIIAYQKMTLKVRHRRWPMVPFTHKLTKKINILKQKKNKKKIIREIGKV